MLAIAEEDCGDDDSGAPYEPAIACCEYGCECEGECGRPDGCGCEWDEYEEVCACECEGEGVSRSSIATGALHSIKWRRRTDARIAGVVRRLRDKHDLRVSTGSTFELSCFVCGSEGFSSRQKLGAWHFIQLVVLCVVGIIPWWYDLTRRTKNLALTENAESHVTSNRFKIR